jgi:hypothetical protein
MPPPTIATDLAEWVLALVFTVSPSDGRRRDAPGVVSLWSAERIPDAAGGGVRCTADVDARSSVA